MMEEKEDIKYVVKGDIEGCYSGGSERHPTRTLSLGEYIYKQMEEVADDAEFVSIRMPERDMTIQDMRMEGVRGSLWFMVPDSGFGRPYRVPGKDSLMFAFVQPYYFSDSGSDPDSRVNRFKSKLLDPQGSVLMIMGPAGRDGNKWKRFPTWSLHRDSYLYYKTIMIEPMYENIMGYAVSLAEALSKVCDMRFCVSKKGMYDRDGNKRVKLEDAPSIMDMGIWNIGKTLGSSNIY